MDEIASIVHGYGPAGLLAVAVYLILTGKLVPSADRDYWRDAFFKLQEQHGKLMVTGEVQRDFLVSLETVFRSKRER